MSATEPAVTPELAAAHGLKPDEYERILKLIGRRPSFTELGIFSAMWNEHCSYKSSRIHLRKLPTKAPWVIRGPGENAGVIDIGDGDACVFKMESHNHPSFIEPYQGAATGVGGILRDVFTMGARPIACLNLLRFGRPAHPRTRQLVAGVVAGVGGYGNSFGVPTVGGSTEFDASYDGNILVNAMAVGLARADAIFYSAAAGVGNPIVYLGSKTGRDGIHGATMASAAFEEDAEEKRPTVQVGDPFKEKLLPVSVAFDAAGNPTPALAGKLKAKQLSHVDPKSLLRESDGKVEALYYADIAKGGPLVSALQSALDEAIAKLPIPKVMSYAGPASYYNDEKFVRPAHRLLALHGADVVPVTALGLTADRITGGHRFLSRGDIAIANADAYAPTLEAEGKVVPSFAKRRASIVVGLEAAATDATPIMPDALLDEVTALTEWPVVYAGSFDPAFLAVPQECLILTMQLNQRYPSITAATESKGMRALCVRPAR